MFERNITVEQISNIIREAEIIKAYDDDKPFPSSLLLAYVKKRPIHIVVAEDKVNLKCIIITAYEPDILVWNQDFKTRK